METLIPGINSGIVMNQKYKRGNFPPFFKKGNRTVDYGVIRSAQRNRIHPTNYEEVQKSSAFKQKGTKLRSIFKPKYNRYNNFRSLR